MTDRPSDPDAGERPEQPLLSRRRLLGAGAGVAGGGILAGFLAWAGTDDDPPRQPGAKPAAPRPLRVLNPAEAETVGAMADRVFPPDGASPGATAVGVVAYLDGQLAGDWGAGARFYRHGPFHEPEDSGHGYQLPLTPRELYKHVLGRIDAHVKERHGGKALSALAPAEQDKLLTDLEAGKIDLGLAHGPNGFTSADFFTIFLQNVAEGLFADPIHGGNQEVEGWKWIRYPGDPMAYDDPYFWFFSSWHTPYDVEPRGLASDAPTAHHHG